MALSPEQEARLNELEAKEQATSTTGLTPEQQARLEELEAKEQTFATSRLTPEKQSRLKELEAKEAKFATVAEDQSKQAEPIPTDTQEELSLLEKANLLAYDFGNQFNNSLINLAGAPVDLISAGINKASNAIAGKDIVPSDSFGGSESIRRGLGMGGVDVVEEAPRTKAGYVGQVTGEAVAFTAPALKMTGAIQGAKRTTSAGKILQEVSDQFVKEATENTGRFLAVEAGAATGAGIARSIANKEELSPGAALGIELLGGIAGAFSGQGLQQVPKSLLKKVQGKNATEIVEMVADETIKYEELDWVKVKDATAAPAEPTPAPESLYDFGSGDPIPVNSDGTITLYHRTNTNPDEIKNSGGFISKENTNEIFVSTKKDGQGEGYGENVIELRVKQDDLEIDDLFDDEAHFRVPIEKANEALNTPVEPSPAPKASMPGEAQRLIKFDQARREMAESAVNKQKADAAVSLNNVDNYNPESKQNPKKAIERILRIFAPSKLVGSEITNAIEKSKGTISRLQETGARVLRATKRLEKANPEVKEHINTFLETGTLHKSLAPIEAELSVWKTQINEMQNLLLDGMDDAAFEGLKPEIKAELRATIEASIDEGYLTQTYRMFQDADYKPTATQMKAAIAEIKTDLVMKGVPVERAEDMAIKHLNRLQANSARNKKIHGKPQGAMPESRGILKERTNPGPAERAWLGEVTDPKEKAFSTASRLARLASAQEEDVAIVRLLLDGKMATRRQVDPSQVQLKLRVSEGDSGIWVSEDVAGSLDILRFGANNPLDTGNVFMDAISRTWNTFVGASKASKVLVNPESYSVNLLGAMASTAASGINPFRLNGIKSALSQFGSLDNILGGKNVVARKAFLEDVGKMQQYGMMAKNVSAADIEKNVQQGLTEYSKAISKGARATISWLGKAYSSGDIALRYTTWKGNQKQLKKMFPDYSDMEIEAAAARLTNQTFQNYDKLSPIIRGLSRLGLMNQFVAFTAELTRNIYNSAKYSQQMMRGTFGKDIGLDPARADVTAMRLTGIKRGAALTATVAGGGAVISELNQGKGITAESEQAFQKTIARDWDENKRLLIIPDETGRKGRYVNPSYLLPHAIANQAFRAGFSEEPVDNLAEFFKEQYIGELGTFPARTAAQLVFGRDEKGRKISVDPRTHQKALDMVGLVYEENLKPGAQNTIERWGDALAGIGDRTVKDNALRLLGFRDTTWDAGDSFRSKIYTINEPLKEAQRRYYSERRKLENNRTSPEEVQKSYEQNNTARRLQVNRLREHYKNMGMKPWSYSVDERIALMKEAGISSSVILDIVDGRYTDIPPVPTVSTADMYDNLDGSTGREKVEAIKEIRETDPVLAKKLFNHHKNLERLNKRNITEREKLISAMDIPKRVDYLIEMGVHNNRALLEEYRRKGIVTKSVWRSMQIRLGQ